MRSALVVGINHYTKVSPLYGCTHDAEAIGAVLRYNKDAKQTVNFDVKVVLGTKQAPLQRPQLRSLISQLFQSDVDTALFYFAGHGHVETTGGYLLTSECDTGDDGIPLSEIMTMANQGPAKNKIIVLDSCHSGIAGNRPGLAPVAELSEGMTVLAASAADQYASEERGEGVFTTLLVDALEGGAASLLGEVSPGSAYAHIDQSLGTWAQRPVFKTNVKTFVSLRSLVPALELADIRRIVELFPDPRAAYPLDPSYEPMRSGTEAADVPPPNPEHVKTFEIFQRCNRLNLLVPVDAPHMWHAAMQSKSCRLTALGRHFRRLAADGRI